ncbi:MAG: DUF4242 domain-containing protein [Chloroflexi bacterium]|nr:DUF4242 domain-containing protein [Chloroflexota bacterium]MDA1145901.1 DUF4242 domain-containing protein [Chloroflexota bacterium]
MTDLFLIEVPSPKEASQADVQPLFDQIAAATTEAKGELIEVQYGRDLGVVYGIIEHHNADILEGLLRHGGLEFEAVVPVQLVGPTLDEVKAHRGPANYLVEWDIPAEIGLDQYLTTKKSKAHLYEQVPETTFMRTYVRQDAIKCLCLYDAPDEAAVRRARDAVSTPIDRLTRIGD